MGGGGIGGAGEKAQLLRALAALAEDISSGPKIFIQWLKTACNSSSGGSGGLF